MPASVLSQRLVDEWLNGIYGAEGTKGSKSASDAKETAARLDIRRGFPPKYGVDSRRFCSAFFKQKPDLGMTKVSSPCFVGGAFPVLRRAGACITSGTAFGRFAVHRAARGREESGSESLSQDTIANQRGREEHETASTGNRADRRARRSTDSERWLRTGHRVGADIRALQRYARARCVRIRRGRQSTEQP